LTPVSRWEPPLWFERLGAIAWRAVVIVAALSLLVAGIVGFGSVILPVVLGLLFTCALQPVARWLRQRGAPPAVASGAATLLLLVALVGVVWLTVSAVVDQWPDVEVLLREGRDALVDGATDTGVEAETAGFLDEDVSEGVSEIVGVLLRGAVHLIPTVASIVTSVLLSVLVTFFFLKDGAAMWRWIVARVDTADGLVDTIGRRVWPVLTGYILGQTAIAACDATMIALGALALGVPQVGAILVITFFGSYVPFIGATVSGFVAVLLAVGDGGIGRGVAMLIVVLAVQLIEGNILQPWIQGKAVKLHPLVVALAITAGGALAGFLGIFLAVPITAGGVVVLSELRRAGVIGSGVSPRAS
jgi:predicted PurR-regulated permease PerM